MPACTSRPEKSPAEAIFYGRPTYLIYSGFLSSFLAAVIALVFIAREGWRARLYDPRLWIRSNPYLGAVALASVYSLLSVPGDAIWHELFGIDLTAWSPPHLILAATSSTVTLCAVALLVRTRFNRLIGEAKDVLIAMLLGLVLNILYIIGVLEWELPGQRSALVEARPVWLYPVVGGLLAFSAIMLARRLTHFRWAATLTALSFYVIRLAIMLGLQQTGNIVPLFPLVFLLGAILVDVVPWEVFPSRLGRILAAPLLFTTGYLVLALPFILMRSDLGSFQAADLAMTFLVTLLVALLLSPLIHFAGKTPGKPAECQSKYISS